MTKPVVDDAIRERFEAKFMPEPMSGCWLWTASVCPSSVKDAAYGTFRFGREQRAHRVSYILYKGPIPSGKIVRHKCDNTYCVNPDHLIAGSLSDNVQDCLRRGRHVAPTGERHGRAKYSTAFVREVRKLYGSGMTPKEIGIKLGIPRMSVAGLINRRPDADDPK